MKTVYKVQTLVNNYVKEMGLVMEVVFHQGAVIQQPAVHVATSLVVVVAYRAITLVKKLAKLMVLIVEFVEPLAVLIQVPAVPVNND